MKSFVLVYERPTGKLETFEFPAGQRAEAFALRSTLQRSADANTEVVVLHAEALADLMTTHRRYFSSVREIAAAAVADAS